MLNIFLIVLEGILLVKEENLKIYPDGHLGENRYLELQLNGALMLCYYKAEVIY